MSVINIVDQGELFEAESVRRTLEREPPTPARDETYLVGLDLGQQHDYTALAIDEIAKDELRRNLHRFRYMARTRGQPYPDVVERVVELLGQPPLLGRSRLIVDATGVGLPVVDLFRRAGTRPIGVTITGGMKAEQQRNGDYHVPKRDLVAAVQVLLQQRRLKVAEQLPEATILSQELQNFQTKITVAANDTYGAWREGQHDDLVLAVALAAWYGEVIGASVGVWSL